MSYPKWLPHLPVMPKTKLMYKYHTWEQFSICLWCQRPYSRTTTRPKNIPQPVCDAKTIPRYKNNAITINASTSLWCQRPFSITKAKTKNNSELIYLPLMPITKLKYKYHTQDDFYPCLWCQRPNSSTNARTKKCLDPRMSLNLSVIRKPYSSTNVITKNTATCLSFQRPFSITKIQNQEQLSICL